MSVGRNGSEAFQERPTEDAPRSGTVHSARRQYHVFMTRNSEYHCRESVCLAVRDRKTGHWLPDHPALGLPVISGLYFDAEAGPQFRPPDIGDPLIFYTNKGRRLMTSPIQGVECPEEETVPA